MLWWPREAPQRPCDTPSSGCGPARYPGIASQERIDGRLLANADLRKNIMPNLTVSVKLAHKRTQRRGGRAEARGSGEERDTTKQVEVEVEVMCI